MCKLEERKCKLKDQTIAVLTVGVGLTKKKTDFKSKII